MDNNTIEELKTMLEKNKKEIEDQLQTFASRGEGEDDWETKFPHEENCDDIECETDEVEEYENLLPVEHSLELKLKNINNALEKIKNNTYGMCEKCHKEIEIERLKIIPEAGTCNNCKI